MEKLIPINMRFTLYIVLLSYISISCNNSPGCSEISSFEHTKLLNKPLTSIKANHSYSDIQIDNKYCYLTNTEGDTIISIYRSDNFEHVKNIINTKHIANNKITFTNEVASQRSSFFLFNETGEIFCFNQEKGSIDKEPLGLPFSLLSCNVFSSSQIIASTIHNSYKNPYCHFINSEFKWILPDSIIQEKLNQNKLLWINYICANEKKRRIAIAYRFLNFISFYDFEGNLLHTLKFGTNEKPLNMYLSARNQKKLFIDIYGTKKFVYALYSGSSDLKVPSKVLKLNWNGKHIETYQLDRPIQAFAVDEKKNRLIAISLNKQEEQEVVCFILK